MSWRLRRILLVAMAIAGALIIWIALRPTSVVPASPTQVGAAAGPTQNAALQAPVSLGADDNELQALEIAARRLVSSGACARVTSVERPIYSVGEARFETEGVFVLQCGPQETYFAVQGGMPIQCGEALSDCPTGSWRPGLRLQATP